MADFLAFLWRHRILITLITGIPVLATVVYVLVVPVQYTASASLLPQDGATPRLLSMAVSALGQSGAGISLPGDLTESNIRESVIKSRRLADLINDDFNLDERYGTDKREVRLRKWDSRLKTRKNKQGLLTIEFRDPDPEFAVQVLERLLEHLDRFNQDLRSTTSRRVRLFLEERVVEASARLAAIEDSLAAYQSSNLALATNPGVEDVVVAGAELLVERVQLETELRVLRQTLGPDAPVLAAKEMEIEALDRELARLPQLNSDLAKLLRARRVHERTYAFLTAQLEETRIEEARDTPTIDLLDPPVIPEEKTWPQRTLSVLAVLLISGAAALGVAYFRDAVKGAQARLEEDRVV